MMARKFLQRQSRSGSKVFDKEDGKDIVGTLNVCGMYMEMLFSCYFICLIVLLCFFFLSFGWCKS